MIQYIEETISRLYSDGLCHTSEAIIRHIHYTTNTPIG